MSSETEARNTDEFATPLSHCTRYHAAVELIGRRWNGVILQQLLNGPSRFSEIRRGIPRLTDAMLSQRLRELEDTGIVKRRVTHDRPIQTTYELTDVGQRLSPILEAIAEWSNEWARR